MAIKPAIKLIWPGSTSVFQTINRPVWPVTLKKLVSKSRFQSDLRDYSALLLQQFGQPDGADLPMAALRFPGQMAICADPCYLHPDRDRLLLFQQDIQLTDNEARQLQTTLMPLLAEFNAQLVSFSNIHWGLVLPKLPEISCHAVSALESQSVTDKLPTGPAQRDWRRLLNEIQMLLFEHPVNQQREANGKLPINAVWFSGTVRLQISANGWQQLAGQDALLESLASALKIPCEIDLADFLKNCPDKDSIVVLPTFDPQADWSEQLDRIERQFLNPVWHYLRRWQLGNVHLSVPQHGSYDLATWRSWL